MEELKRVYAGLKSVQNRLMDLWGMLKDESLKDKVMEVISQVAVTRNDLRRVERTLKYEWFDHEAGKKTNGKD